MKKYLSFLTAILAITMVSCNKKTAEPAVVEKSNETGVVLLAIAPDSAPESKATSTTVDESMIKSLQIFVFDAVSGAKETDKYESSTSNISTMTLTTLTGYKKIWAVANAPRLYVTTESELKSSVSSLGDNSITGLTMVGVAAASNPGSLPHTAGTVNVTPYTVGNNDSITQITIPIYRLGTRISLQKVTVDFSGTYLEGSSFEIKDLYLKNVVNAVYFDGTAVPLSSNAGYWTNKVAEHAPNGSNLYIDSAGNDVTGLICDKGLSGLLTTTTNGSSSAEIAVNKYWYVYPNSITTDSEEIAWSPRHTRLVMHAVVNNTARGITNKNTYYVFTLPPANIPVASENVLLGNHTYDITNIVVSMLGKDNDDDDRDTKTGKIQVTISVSGWEQEYTFTYEF